MEAMISSPPRAGGELPVVERHVVEAASKPASTAGKSLTGQPHAGERGVDGERYRGHEHTQEGHDRASRYGGRKGTRRQQRRQPADGGRDVPHVHGTPPAAIIYRLRRAEAAGPNQDP